MLHELKIEEPYAMQILHGKKTFEIRYNDRGYNAGDTVKLVPIIGIAHFSPIYADIGYVTNYQQKDGYVVFSLLNVRNES